MADWTLEVRAHYRDLASRGACGPVLWADSVVDLLDLLEAAEKRAGIADGLQARLDAVAALHRPVMDGVLICQVCVGERGANLEWPCDTAGAMSARGDS